jgi:hypothetical protein
MLELKAENPNTYGNRFMSIGRWCASRKRNRKRTVMQ